MQSIRANIELVQSGVASALHKAGRSQDDCLLVAVTKTHPASFIQAALEAGITDFGENKVQEAAAKLPELMELLPDTAVVPHFHFIGHLQSNKVNALLRLHPWLIESVDSVSLATSISKAIESLGPEAHSPQDILIQVNTSGEASKSGMTPATARAQIEQIAQLPHLQIKGLMTIGLLADDPEAARAGFKELKILFDELKADHDPRIEMKYLSMGMTDDHPIAISEGANLVRIGSAIFGYRKRGTL